MEKYLETLVEERALFDNPSHLVKNCMTVLELSEREVEEYLLDNPVYMGLLCKDSGLFPFAFE